MAVLPHEGTHSIMYGAWPIPIGSRQRTAYLARPDAARIAARENKTPPADSLDRGSFHSRAVKPAT